MCNNKIEIVCDTKMARARAETPATSDGGGLSYSGSSPTLR